MADLIKTLRGVGDVAARGELSIDRDKAREKLQKFRLPDPYLYVLQFVRAASILSADEIVFEISASEMRCQFDKILPAGRLSDLWASAFEHRDSKEDDAMHCVALGIGSAQALRPKSIEIRSGSEALRIVEEEEVYESSGEAFGGTQIHLQEKWRFGHLFEFLGKVDGLYAEGRALRTYCRWALLDIIVNDDSLNDRSGTYETAFQRGDAKGFVRLAPSDEPSTFVFMRDNVQVRVHHAPAHGVPALGALNSRTLQTDLSGLQLAPDETLDELLQYDLYDAYHESLRRWLEHSGTRSDHLVAAAALFDHLARLDRSGWQAPKGTRALYGYILREPLFRRSDERNRSAVSLDFASAGGLSTTGYSGQIGTTRGDVGPVTIDGYSCILLREHGSLEDHALSALREMGVTVRDVTIRAESARVAVRNREVWEARPITEEPRYSLQRYAVSGDYKGFVFFPTHPANGALIRDFGARLRRDGKQLRRIAAVLQVGIVVDGPLHANERFDDVLRDDAFRDLALALVRQLPPLYFKLAEDEELMADRFAAELLLEYVQARLNGSLAIDFFTSLGYQLEESLVLVQESLADEPQFTRLWEVFSRREVEPFLESLGPVADAPLFRSAEGAQRSLRSLVEADEPPTVLPISAEDPPESFHGLPNLVCLNEIQETIIKTIRPDTVDARIARHRKRREATFLTQPTFSLAPFPFVLSKAMDSETVDVGGVPTRLELELELVGDGSIGPPRGCEVYFVHRERLLAERSWSAELGAFRLVLRSNGWTPNPQMSDVEEDLLYDHAKRRGDALIKLLLERWYLRCVTEGDVGQRWLRLFMHYAVGYAEREPTRPAFPVLVRGAVAWEQRFISRQDLQEAIDRNAKVLYYTRVDEGVAQGEVTEILRVGQWPSKSLQLHFHGVRLSQVGSSEAQESARERYERKPIVPFEPTDADSAWRGEVSGLDVQVEFVTEDLRNGRRECNRVEVLWENRRLEQLVVAVPIGRFRSIIAGDAISPDPAFKLVAAGRSQVLEAALAGPAAAIRHVCDSLPLTTGSRTAKSEGLRLELLRYLGHCRRLPPLPPFDVLDALTAAPLFETGDGRYIAAWELGSMAREGVIGFAPHLSRSDVLRFAIEDRALYEGAIAEEFALMLVYDLDQVLDDDEVLELSEDVVLNRIANLLVAVRGERRDLFGDDLAYSLRWMTPSEGSPLCAVSPSTVLINPDDPLVVQLRASPQDRGLLAFVASTVYSSVNAYYSEITDGDEIAMQARLLDHMKRLLSHA